MSAEKEQVPAHPKLKRQRSCRQGGAGEGQVSSHAKALAGNTPSIKKGPLAEDWAGHGELITPPQG